MQNHARNSSRKLPVVLQIRHMSDRKRSSDRFWSAFVGWSGRSLAFLAAIPIVSLAVFVSWQLIGEPSDDVLLPINMPQSTMLDEHEFEGAAATSESFKSNSHNDESVASAAYQAPSRFGVEPSGADLQPATPVGFASGDTDSSNASKTTRSPQRIQIHSVVPMPPAQVQLSERDQTLLR